MLDDEPPGLRRVAAGVPAERRLTGQLGHQPHGLGDVRALDLGLDELVADPAQAVAGDLVAALARTPRPPRGLRASAIATPKTVSGSPRRSNTRSTRHSPARDPYSYSDSMLMCRFGNGWAPMISERNVSDAWSPCSTLFSAPSS